MPGTQPLIHAASFIDRFLSRHSTSTALMVAYASFAYRLCHEVWQVQPATLKWERSGVELMDPEVKEPLTRTSALMQAKSSGHKLKRNAGVSMRRESDIVATENFDEEDEAAALLQRALKVAAGKEDPSIRGHLLQTIYTSLGHVYSAHAQYWQVLHAMELSINAAASTSNDAVAHGHLTFAQLELKHHRYYAAQTRFEDALMFNSTNKTLAHQMQANILSGLGWAYLMQDNLGTARDLFHAAFRHAGLDNAMLRIAEGESMQIDFEGICSAQDDGLDNTRAVALAGSGIILYRSANTLQAQANQLIECAAIMSKRQSQNDLNEHNWPHSTLAIGLAYLASGRTEMSKRYHRRFGQLEAKSGIDDLARYSHSKLYLGLGEFHTGNASSSIISVESLVSRAGVAPDEAVEWLVRFARAHRWLPSGPAFGALLFDQASTLLQNVGDNARLAKHLVAFGRFLYSLGQSYMQEVINQLQRALDLVDKYQLAWPGSEVAAVHSLMGISYHQLNQASDAVRSFTSALALDKAAIRRDSKRSYEVLMTSYINLGAARLQLKGLNEQEWRAALADFQHARKVAQQIGLTHDDSRVASLEKSIQNGFRLGHRKGLAATCPSALANLLVRPVCSRDN